MAKRMKVPKFLKSVRYSLAGVNGLFLVTGIILLILGIVVLVQYNDYDELITQQFFTLPGFVIATAVIIFVASVVGFYGAISEQFYFIVGYVILLLVVLIFEMSIVIMGFRRRDGAASEIRSTMLQTLQFYDTRVDVAKLWDDLHMEFECCGVSSVYDWVTNRIPVSCCHIDYGTVSPFECTLATAYSTGCASALGDWLSGNAQAVAYTALVITCLQVLITAAAGWLAWRSRFEEVELES